MLIIHYVIKRPTSCIKRQIHVGNAISTVIFTTIYLTNLLKFNKLRIRYDTAFRLHNISIHRLS